MQRTCCVRLNEVHESNWSSSQNNFLQAEWYPVALKCTCLQQHRQVTFALSTCSSMLHSSTVQVYKPGKGLAFHFDKDEHVMKEHQQMLQPVLSSVLYLTGDSNTDRLGNSQSCYNTPNISARFVLHKFFLLYKLFLVQLACFVQLLVEQSV